MAHPAAAVPCSRVELRIRCNHLQDRDITSKSDPCAVLFMQDKKGNWYEEGRTENIKNTLDPKFAKSFELDYYFEEVQKVRVALYDIDNKSVKLSDDDFLGQTECTLGQIVSAGAFTRPLMKKDKKQAGKGIVTIMSEELQGLNDVYTMTFQAKNLDKKDTFSKSDPYLEFQRQSADGQWQVVHRTEVVKNNLNPTWRPVVIKAQKLCAGDVNRPIKMVIFDFDEKSTFDDKNDLIGEVETSVANLRNAVDNEVSWPCINPKKKAKKSSYKDSGTVILTSCTVQREFSFLDFIYGGLQINFTVGIDFTASNGDPRNAQSLHYINPYEPNEYLRAIQAVGEVVQDYDTDKMFPALGFGARVPPNFEVSHEFAINFNSNNPFCAGIQGVMETYKACIGQIQLYGPTNFSPIIYHAAKFGLASQQEGAAKNYFVLLILTDGVISDMDATREAIVYASHLPVSIIIVGVGKADFSAMTMLDGDDGVLKAPSGKKVQRDIVQFVPLRDFVHNGKEPDEASAGELAKHVLAEVPKQVTDYFKMVGMTPVARPPPAAAVANSQ